MKYIEKSGWFIDENNNRASVKFWGSAKKAKQTLGTLINCFNCINCTDCTDCFHCADSTDCTGCVNCVNCVNCYDCTRCGNCVNCTNCYDCIKQVDKINKLLDLKVPFLHQKVYASAQLDGALKMETWETECGMVMCHGGWIVHHAGEKGYALKEATSWEFAAKQIAKASGLSISPTQFFNKTNEQALAEMKIMADKETLMFGKWAAA